MNKYKCIVNYCTDRKPKTQSYNTALPTQHKNYTINFPRKKHNSNPKITKIQSFRHLPLFPKSSPHQNRSKTPKKYLNPD
uniref:26S proteasome non-ATPase regulatory subunit 1 homolog A n=1 Tax=Rhizophora mucronata TaxID=61149 RepID=A0A2P2MRF4_RHIMU